MLTQTDMNSADAIFRLWDAIDSIERTGNSYYDHSLGEAGKWVKVDKPFLDGMRHAVNLIAYAAFEPKRTGEDFAVDYDVIDAEIDAKLEELRETWEQYQIQQSEIRAEQRNEQALYGPW